MTNPTVREMLRQIQMYSRHMSLDAAADRVNRTFMSRYHCEVMEAKRMASL